MINNLYPVFNINAQEFLRNMLAYEVALFVYSIG